jgi:hypothetical protein
MANIQLLDNNTRIRYGSKIYKTNSKTGFKLYRRHLTETGMLVVMTTSNESYFAFDGVKLRYYNPVSGNNRTFTEAGQVGSRYIKRLRASLGRGIPDLNEEILQQLVEEIE